MRHRRKGRKLGRTASHRRAMLRNLASSLFLTERDADLDPNQPKVKGRVVTTLHKAKEVRPLVEKCITIARRSLPHQENARQYETDADRDTDQWRSWRTSERWQQWNHAIAPAVAARRRALQLLGNKEAVRLLFDEVAPRFADRPGGYTRILKMATPRLGDAGPRAILEFVGVHDRVSERTERPAFSDEEPEEEQDVAASDDTAPEDTQAEGEQEPPERQPETESAKAEADSPEATSKSGDEEQDKPQESG